MRWIGLFLIVTALSLIFAIGHVRGQAQGTVSGVVMELDGGPVAGAVVRQQATTNSTTSTADGSFTLGGLTEGITVTITAWHEGYLVGGAEVVPPQSGVTITLKRHYTTDNPDYQWFSSNDPEGPVSCLHCMVAWPQWRANAHGNSGTNPRFFSMYNGTDITGTTTVPPGYKLDFPDTAGNCATCHAPAAAVRGLRTFAAADMNELEGVEQEGVFCEFCHKVGAVYLNPATGLPYNNAPGVLSMRLYRPPPGEQVFFGPFDDVTRRVSYLELEKKSQFCAPCHQFSFWGTPIYQSFKEWLESPYATQGIHCQACHMKPTGVNYFVFPEKGGLIRDPDLIASHLQPGASDAELLQNTVSMTVSAQQIVDTLRVTVTITNTGAGHHVPTDHPARNMILLVRATDDQGRELVQMAGPKVPDWGGVGSDPNDYAGWPGKGYAKVLKDVQSGEAPVASYWKQTLIQSDNRLAAFEADTTTYDFLVPEEGSDIEVEARLIFRRAFKPLAEAKGWEMEDITMETDVVALSLRPTYRIYLPIFMKSYASSL
jgi:nitrate/TMAO reductase-like tetraheme cytochrome c subunit